MRHFAPAATLLAALALAAPAAAEGLCPAWSEPSYVGLLDPDMLGEASGLEISTAFPGHLYHHNDSGDDGVFYVTDLATGLTRRIAVDGLRPRDMEDISLGPCGAESCIYLADVGDNQRRRELVIIAVVEERPDLPDTVEPRALIAAHYPDKPHNAEAVAVHPNGDLFLLTKADDERRATSPAMLFRLTAAQLAEGGEQTFALLGEIDLPELTGADRYRGRIPTAMDIAPDGSRFMLLTYESMVEIAVDLSAGLGNPENWVEGEDYSVTTIATLPQAEGLAYSEDGLSVLYDTEFLRNSAPLVLQSCAGEAP